MYVSQYEMDEKGTKYRWPVFISTFLSYIFDNYDNVILAISMPVLISVLNISYAQGGLLVSVTMVNALVGVQTETDTTTMFPDVPENHWAYEAVAAMAKSGLVKGYPDGEFKGDRTMTRYEFAQIVYNAIQAGAEVDARLVEEFKPELEYFHIATVAKDKDGNPTIERVRAN